MPLYTADALILRTYKLGEADRIVVFLTRDRGKKRGVARGARRPRSRFQGGLEPLTRVRVTYFERERRELVSLNDVDTLRSPLSLDDAARLGHVGYFAELLDAWAADADADERLYRLGAAAVDALTGDVPLDRLARYFEYWLLRLQGVYPPIQACHACGEGLGDGAVVGADDRVFVCRRCAVRAGGVALSRDAMAFLGAAAGTPVSRLASLPWSARTARELEAAHRRLIVAHLDKELKSPRVLRELGAPPGSRASAADGRRRLDGSV